MDYSIKDYYHSNWGVFNIHLTDIEFSHDNGDDNHTEIDCFNHVVEMFCDHPDTYITIPNDFKVSEIVLNGVMSKYEEKILKTYLDSLTIY
jgi:hypothetical protein